MLNYLKYRNMNCFYPNLQEQCRCLGETLITSVSPYKPNVQRDNVSDGALLTDRVFLGDLKLNGGKLEEVNAVSCSRFSDPLQVHPSVWEHSRRVWKL